MVEGSFIDLNKPMVSADIAWGQAVQTASFILDTGFTGDLVVPPAIARELGLVADIVMPAQLAGNNRINLPAATAIAVMEGRQLYVTVMIAEGWPLLGISFMEKFAYTAVIDCKNKTVALEHAP